MKISVITVVVPSVPVLPNLQFGSLGVLAFVMRNEIRKFVFCIVNADTWNCRITNSTGRAGRDSKICKVKCSKFVK